VPIFDPLVKNEGKPAFKRVEVGAPVVLGAVQTILKLARVEDIMPRPTGDLGDLEDMSIDQLRATLNTIEQRLGDAAVSVDAQPAATLDELPNDYSVLD
jgi:hypothetical protein